jgi:hypothetical protein
VYHPLTGERRALTGANPKESQMRKYLDRNARLLAPDGHVLQRMLKDNPFRYNQIVADRCRHCGAAALGLGGYLQSDGRIAVRMFCGNCYEDQTGDLKVPQEIRNAVGIIWRKDGKPCQVYGCGDVYSQMHHVLPRCIDATMAERFPTVWLCLMHHRMWHELTGIGISEWR